MGRPMGTRIERKPFQEYSLQEMREKFDELRGELKKALDRFEFERAEDIKEDIHTIYKLYKSKSANVLK